MKLLRLALFIVVSTLATSSFAQSPMPDYSKWSKTADHSGPYLLKGVPVEMRDVHYEFVNPEQTKYITILEFYNPYTEKPWFSIYIHDENNKEVTAFLYEADKNGAWVFVEDVSKIEEADVLKKYDLVEM